MAHSSHIGRTDGQLKLRGLRVEPGEIECRHRRGPPGRGLGRRAPRGHGRPVLTGYLVPATGAPPDTGQITEHLARRLPDHMVPTALIALHALPLTPSGKLDRAARCPAPDLAATATAVAPRVHPGSRAHRTLAELLGIPNAGAEDSFFALGGDGILSIQLVARARKAGMALTPGTSSSRRPRPRSPALAATTGPPPYLPLAPTGRAPLTVPAVGTAARTGREPVGEYAQLVTPPRRPAPR